MPPPLQYSLNVLADNRSSLSTEDRDEIFLDLFHEGDRSRVFMHRFLSLMTLSVVIAVLGLLANSTAVVIGAMLVAPLMGPVLGVSAALVMDWPRRILTSGITVAIGSVVAIGLAVVISFIVPGDPERLSEELLARTSPTILDLGVALVAGAAGAYAKVRRQAGDAIVGVAVAVALVPPLAVTGITLEIGRYQMALGSFLLFLANVSGIITAGAITFVVFGLVPTTRLRSTRSHVAGGLRLAALGTLLIVAPLQMIDQWRPDATIDSDPETLVEDAVTAWRQDVSVIDMDLTLLGDDDVPRIELTVTEREGNRPLEVDQLAEQLSAIIGRPVEIAVTTVESNVTTAAADESGNESAETETVDPESTNAAGRAEEEP